MIWGFLGKPLKDKMPPKWSLVAQTSSKLILGGSQFHPKQNVQIQNPKTTKSGNPKTSDVAKMRTTKISRMVYLRSSQLEGRAIWRRKRFCISIDHPCISMDHPWTSANHPWITMNTYGSSMGIHGWSRVFMAINGYPWISHGHPWIPIHVHPWVFTGDPSNIQGYPSWSIGFQGLGDG